MPSDCSGEPTGCRLRRPWVAHARRRFPSLFVLIYVGVGVAIAAERNYFQNVHGFRA